MYYKGKTIAAGDIVHVRLRVEEVAGEVLVVKDPATGWVFRMGTTPPESASPSIVAHLPAPPEEPPSGSFVGIVGEGGVVPTRDVWKRIGGVVAPWVNVGTNEVRSWQWLLNQSHNGADLRLLTVQKLQ